MSNKAQQSFTKFLCYFRHAIPDKNFPHEAFPQKYFLRQNLSKNIFLHKKFSFVQNAQPLSNTRWLKSDKLKPNICKLCCFFVRFFSISYGFKNFSSGKYNYNRLFWTYKMYLLFKLHGWVFTNKWFVKLDKSN